MVEYIGLCNDISSEGNFQITGDWGPDDSNGTTQDRNAAVGITCLSAIRKAALLSSDGEILCFLSGISVNDHLARPFQALVN